MQKTIPFGLLNIAIEIIEYEIDRNNCEVPISVETITWLCDRLRLYGSTELAAELAAITEIDEGWTPASSPPHNNRDVILKLDDGEIRIGWSLDIAGDKWRIYRGYLDGDLYGDAYKKVTAWRELTEAEK